MNGLKRKTEEEEMNGLKRKTEEEDERRGGEGGGKMRKMNGNSLYCPL